MPDNDHPLEPIRRKEPVGKLCDEAFGALDHVLGYVTLKGLLTNDPEVGSRIEGKILEMFDDILKLKEELKKVVPPDDF